MGSDRKAFEQCGFSNGDLSEVVTQEAVANLAPAALMLPINGVPTQSIAGDGMLVTLIGEGPNGVVDRAIVAVGIGGNAAIFVAHDAAQLRALAGACMRAAELLDGGRGKQ